MQKKMKQAGIAFDVIAQVTGLSIGEKTALRNMVKYSSLSKNQNPSYEDHSRH